MSFVVFTENSKGKMFAQDFHTYGVAKAMYEDAIKNGDVARMYEAKLLLTNQ